jgi:hypothetical protein
VYFLKPYKSPRKKDKFLNCVLAFLKITKRRKIKLQLFVGLTVYRNNNNNYSIVILVLKIFLYKNKISLINELLLTIGLRTSQGLEIFKWPFCFTKLLDTELGLLQIVG